jgi:tRNA acetyltransferase TAN1
VEKVCSANLPEIGRCAKELTEAHFPAGEGAPSVRFAVAYEHRASKEFERMDVINAVVNQIPQVMRSARLQLFSFSCSFALYFPH